MVDITNMYYGNQITNDIIKVLPIKVNLKFGGKQCHTG